MARLESDFQKNFIKKLKLHFRGCLVLKNDSGYLQGIPDLTILYGDRWAVLEVKRSANEAYEPNQEYYLNELGKWSYTATVYPENEEVILDELDFHFTGDC